MNDDQFARLSRLLRLQFLFVTGLFVVYSCLCDWWSMLFGD